MITIGWLSSVPLYELFELVSNIDIFLSFFSIFDVDWRIITQFLDGLPL